MGKSLEARFNGSSSEVVEYAKQFGIFKAMEHYKVATYDRFLAFLEQTEPGYAFQMVKKNDPDSLTGYESTRNLCLAMLEAIHHAKAESANKDVQIARLTRELEYFKSMHRNESSEIVQAILSECKS